MSSPLVGDTYRVKSATVGLGSPSSRSSEVRGTWPCCFGGWDGHLSGGMLFHGAWRESSFLGWVTWLSTQSWLPSVLFGIVLSIQFIDRGSLLPRTNHVAQLRVGPLFGDPDELT